ncbi:MAG: phosphoribosylaminoimidazolesuccinocarboxamide synthase [Chloroflexi bacterium]|nr:phosphoribosylaminoimidazolesuccinocarboxamide synthase [Chloroflexota bacterium]
MVDVLDAAPRHLRSGKVRDLYRLDDERLLLVASDRISAFDVVLPTLVPDKGRVLTGLSRHWFALTAAVGICRNHVLATASSDAELRGRVMVCRRTRVLPAEFVVRGFLAGSGTKEYLATGAICGIALAGGLREGDSLPEPILTPATKAETGHDQNIGFDTLVEIVGGDLAERCRAIALALYRFAAGRATGAGLILADTKFEFGVMESTGELLLIDEALTPDSSRFWDARTWKPGNAQPSFDKQYLRDWLETLDWDKTAPGPELPAEVVEGSRARYIEAFERLTGSTFDAYLRTDRLPTEAGAGTA